MWLFSGSVRDLDSHLKKFGLLAKQIQYDERDGVFVVTLTQKPLLLVLFDNVAYTWGS